MVMMMDSGGCCPARWLSVVDARGQVVPSYPATRRRCAGFGLVELMIALALGTVLLLGITQLFSSGSRSLGDVSAAGQNIENATYAIDVISSDLRLVGYWGEVLGVETTPDVLTSGEVPSGFPPAAKFPGPCLGQGDNFGTGSFSEKVELAWGMEFPLFASRSDYSNYGAVIPCGVSGAEEPASDSEFVVVRRASTCAALDGNCTSPDSTPRFHIQTNGCYDPSGTGLVGGEIRLASVTSSDWSDSGNLEYLKYNLNGCTISATGAAYAPIYRYVSHTYFVSSDDVLYRLAFNGAAFEVEALVDGVEAMRFEWGRDTDGDGTVDEFKGTLAAATAGWLDEWKDVVAVKIWLLVRGGESISGFSDSNKYSLAGVPFTVAEANKKYPRRLVTRLIELPNIAGPRR